MTDNGKNAHIGLYGALHCHYNFLRHNHSDQTSRCYTPDSLTSLIADEFLTSPIRLFRNESLHVKFLNDPSETFLLSKLMVIAVFSFQNYEYFLQRTMEFLPDMSDDDLPLRDNPAPEDEKYTKCFDVFFWNQYLFYESDRFLDLINWVVTSLIKMDQLKKLEREGIRQLTGATEDVPAEADGNEGAAGKMYTGTVRTAENLGLQEGGYVHRVCHSSYSPRNR